MDRSLDKFAAILIDVRRGRAQAFADLLRPYRNKLERMAQRLVGPMLQPHVDAADFLQELQLILWLGLVGGTYEVATPGQLLALAKRILGGCASRHWHAVKPLNTTL